MIWRRRQLWIMVTPSAKGVEEFRGVVLWRLYCRSLNLSWFLFLIVRSLLVITYFMYIHSNWLVLCEWDFNILIASTQSFVIATSGTHCLDKDLSFQDWRPFFNPCSYSKFNHLSACLHAHTALILYYWTISGCYTTILFVLSRFVASLVFACFAYPIAPFPVTRGFNGQDLHFEKCLGRGYFGEASEVIESVATWQFSSILAIWTGFLK